MALKCRPTIPKHEERALAYDKPISYRPGVRIGRWAEHECGYQKQCYKHTSTYSREYQPKPPQSRLDALWKNRFRAAGFETPLFFDYDAKYLNNYSTSSHLSYDFLPKVYRCKEHHPLVKEAEPDYTRNYGNLIDYGLREHKRCAWLEDSRDRRRTSVTTYEETFVEHPEAVKKTYEKPEDDYREVCNPITWECTVECKR